MTDFSIQQQIEEVEREIELRRKVYPSLVRTHQMRQSVADYHIGRMQAVKRTLEFDRDHRAAWLEWLKAGKPKAEKAA